MVFRGGLRAKTFLAVAQLQGYCGPDLLWSLQNNNNELGNKRNRGSNNNNNAVDFMLMLWCRIEYGNKQ